MKIVLLMALAFGLVGIDRFLISAMFPVIRHDLHLSYGDIGTITGALALAWGVAALCVGSLSDRVGRRRVVVLSLLLFSLLIGASGLAEGLFGLVLVRIGMGFADGAFAPAGISATLDASRPGQSGRNIGIQQMAMPLFGLGIAPLVVTELLHVINWRWIFPLFIAPGLILAFLSARALPRPMESAHVESELSIGRAWQAALRYRNVRVLMGCMLCWLVCLITTSAFMPNYLIDHLGLTTTQMGRVLSSIGLGAAAGTLLLPWLSDIVGRQPVMIASTLGTLAALVGLSLAGPNPAILFGALFAVHFFNNALITLTVGPVCAESVPPHLSATAAGVVIAFGELAGGGLGPVLAGQMAEHFGLARLLLLPIAALALGFMLCTFGLQHLRPGTDRFHLAGAAEF